MKKLLLVVVVMLSLPSVAQNCWTIPTQNTCNVQTNNPYTQRLQVRQQLEAQYQQAYYQQTQYQQAYYQQPYYQQPYYTTTTSTYYSGNNNNNVAYMIGDIINGIASEVRKSKRRRQSNNHNGNCECCR
tara:strand:+ start:2152 stop:2538 length:387 start_codon:yes stop_codon:yes gene_type:complete